MKSQKLLDDFMAYCVDHPKLRFWQALAAWSGHHCIYIGTKDPETLEPIDLEDTFYREEK